MDQSKLNRLRRMAGVPEDFRAPKRIVKEDLVPGMGPAIKKGGKHLFYLVSDATPKSELADVLSEVDTQGLINIIRGVLSMRDGQAANKTLSEFELFPHEKQNEALNLARQRLVDAGSKEQVKEFQMEFGVSAKNPNATPVPDVKFGSEAKVCKVCASANCKCPKEQEEDQLELDMGDDSDMDMSMDQEMDSDDAMDFERDAVGRDEMADDESDMDMGMDDEFGADDLDHTDTEAALRRLAAELEGGDVEGFEDELGGLGDQADDWDDIVGRRARDEMSDDEFQFESAKILGKPISWKNAQKVLKKMKKKPLKESAHYHTDDHYPSFADTNKGKPVNVVADYDTVFDKDGKKEEDYEMSNDTTKVKVPSKVISELDRVIKEVQAEAEKAKPRDWERSNYYADTAEAFQIVLDFLKMKTVEGLKRAQIYSQRMNSASRALMPDVTWKFIVDGGQKRSLKAYMTDVSKDFPVTGKPMDVVPVKTLNKNTHTE